MWTEHKSTALSRSRHWILLNRAQDGMRLAVCCPDAVQMITAISPVGLSHAEFSHLWLTMIFAACCWYWDGSPTAADGLLWHCAYAVIVAELPAAATCSRHLSNRFRMYF